MDSGAPEGQRAGGGTPAVAMLEGSAIAAPRAPRRLLSRSRLVWGAGLVLAGIGLATLYFRQSLIAPFNSDGAANVLQAQAMLHGNVLLSGWWTSDVSFYTTELPEYMLVTLLRGVAPDVVHICGALTYTLTVLLGALVARGTRKGRAGVTAALVAGGIMLAPGIIGGTSVFLENPDHAGTAVPVLLLLLVLDRAPARWYVPVAVCALLAWTQVADQLTLVAATVPVAAVAVARLGMLAIRRRGRAELGYEALLAVAAGVSVLLTRGAESLLRHLGGFALHPLPQKLLATRSQITANAHVMGQTILVLFGANGLSSQRDYLGPIAAFHLIGLALAGAGLAAGVATFFARQQDRVTQIVVVATLAVLAAGILGTELPSLSHAHEVAVLLPFGAVLAGRLLPPLLPPLLSRLLPSGTGGAGRDRVARVLLPVLGLWLACALAAVCYAATWAPLPPPNQALATWLSRHGFREGLAAYWQAGSTTVDSGGRVLVATVASDGKSVRPWEASADWYDPGTHRADFVVATNARTGSQYGLSASVEREVFGPPAREYRVGDDVIMVYRYNLLTRLSGRSFPGPSG